MKMHKRFPVIILAVAAMLSLLLPASQAAEYPSIGGERQALVIGNNAYQGGGRLHKCVDDARGMQDVLQDAGFNVLFAPDVDLRAMEQAVSSFISSLGPGDIAFFYYSGHGMQVEGVNYMIPIDFRLTDPADIRWTAYPADRVRERMEGTGTRLNIIVLDACRSNPFSGAKNGYDGLAAMQTGRGTYIAFATAPGDTATEASADQYSMFTSHLIQALRLPGLTHDEIFNRVRAAVDRATNHEQVPWSVTSVIGNFYFRPPETEELEEAAAGEQPARSGETATPSQTPSAAGTELFASGSSAFESADYSEAARLFRTAADEGSAPAQNMLGVMREYGYGVEQDYGLALEWFRHAAQSGNADAQANLGYLYLYGMGTAENPAEAFRWFNTAASQGHARGQYRLGYMYELGRGVTADLEEAVRWYRLASEQGYTSAKEALERLGR